MTLIFDALTLAVPCGVAAGLGTWAAIWTAHNTAVERIRWIGPRPSLRLPPEDKALRHRMNVLRHLGNVMASAGREAA